MWQEPIKDLLKLECPKDPVSQNFNPYEVLEPQKVDLKDKILVDLTPDDVDKPDANLEMGSFVDTVSKTDYSLIDLFQNIYVTPQHLQKSPTQIDEDSLIEFGNFFDKLEAKNTQHDITPVKLEKSDKTSFDELIHRSVESYATINDISKTIENEIKNMEQVYNLDATLGATYKSSIPKFDTSIPEKSESLFNNIKSLPVKNDLPMETPKATKLDSSEYKTDYDYMNYHMTKQTTDHAKVIPHNNSRDCPDKSELSHFQLTDSMRRNILDEIKKEEIPIICKCHYASNILNFKSMDASFINPFDDDLPVTNSKDLKKPKAINMLSNNQFTHIKSGQLLQTAVKDQKLYAKQMNLKENNQYLTKAPDIYEKSIVLPQIMERLAARKKKLDDQGNWRRRLVLDSGVSEINEDVHSVKTQVLMADCNKVRLTNLKVRKSFENFIKAGTPK